MGGVQGGHGAHTGLMPQGCSGEQHSPGPPVRAHPPLHPSHPPSSHVCFDNCAFHASSRHEIEAMPSDTPPKTIGRLEQGRASGTWTEVDDVDNEVSNNHSTGRELKLVDVMRKGHLDKRNLRIFKKRGKRTKVYTFDFNGKVMYAATLKVINAMHGIDVEPTEAPIDYDLSQHTHVRLQMEPDVKTEESKVSDHGIGADVAACAEVEALLFWEACLAPDESTYLLSLSDENFSSVCELMHEDLAAGDWLVHRPRRVPMAMRR